MAVLLIIIFSFGIPIHKNLYVTKINKTKYNLFELQKYIQYT